MSKHTQEPWRAFIQGNTIALFDSEKREIISWVGFDSSHFPNTINKANVRRIVACVNACAGIPTGELEAYRVKVEYPKEG